MPNEFSGIEKRLDELSERLARLEQIRTKKRSDFNQDAYLRDIVERNLEIAAQCCIDICNRIISQEGARKPENSYGGFIVLGELGVLSPDFAARIAPLAGFRNILVHEYISINWDLVYQYLQNLDDLVIFYKQIREWLSKSQTS